MSPSRSCTHPSIVAEDASAELEADNARMRSSSFASETPPPRPPRPPRAEESPLLLLTSRRPSRAGWAEELKIPCGDAARLSCEMNLRLMMEWIRNCTWSGTSVPPFSMPRFSASHSSAGISHWSRPSRCTNQCSNTVENMSWDSTSELARYCSSSCPTSSPLPEPHSCTSVRPRVWASARCFLHQTRATPLTRRSIICRSSGICMEWKASTRAETTPVCSSAIESKMPKRISGQSEKVAPRNSPTFARLASPLLKSIFIPAV
mmetsp:Transcript_18742/g.58910  ORF Transcript_18742/g.58910 Transcript_18742/m.58910 type:complete len:263 (-) Transcript_18742:844-1632(-)